MAPQVRVHVCPNDICISLKTDASAATYFAIKYYLNDDSLSFFVSILLDNMDESDLEKLINLPGTNQSNGGIK